MARHTQHGIQLKIGDGAGTEQFTAVAQLVGVTPPRGRRGFTPIAEHDMTGAIEILMDALRDEGPVGLRLHFDPAHATHNMTTGLIKKFRDGGIHNFQLVYPDSGALLAAFAAGVTEFGGEDYNPNTGIGTATAQLQISGAITYTP